MPDPKLRLGAAILAVILSVPLVAADRVVQHQITLQLSGTEIALIITAISSLVGVVGGIVIQLRGQSEARKARTELRAELGGKMDEVKTSTDGIATKLGEAKLAQGTAEGHAEGLQQGRAETK